MENMTHFGDVADDYQHVVRELVLGGMQMTVLATGARFAPPVYYGFTGSSDFKIVAGTATSSGAFLLWTFQTPAETVAGRQHAEFLASVRNGTFRPTDPSLTQLAMRMVQVLEYRAEPNIDDWAAQLARDVRDATD